MTTTLADKLHDIIHEATNNLPTKEKEDVLFYLRSMVYDLWEDAYETMREEQEENDETPFNEFMEDNPHASLAKNSH